MTRPGNRAVQMMVGVALALGSLALAPAVAQTRASPTAMAALVLRVLSYDRTLRARSPQGRVRVLVVYRASVPGEREGCEAIARAIGLLGRSVKISGMSTEATAHAFSSTAALTAAGRGFQAVYVCSALDGSISAVAETARSLSLLTMSPREEDVRAGLAVAIVSEPRLHLVVNVTAAAAEGAGLDPALLRIATLLR